MDNILSAKIQVTAPGVEQTFQQVGDSAAAVNKVLSQLGKEGVVSIGGIQDALKQFKQILSVTTDPKDIAKLNIAITALKSKLSDLNFGSAAQGLDHVSESSRRLNSSFLQLSRSFDILPPEVAHIAHSFDGLLESFEQVHQKAGKSATVLQTLGSILSGPAGIGVGISIAIGLLSEFAQELFDSGNEAEASASALEGYKQTVDSVKDSIKSLSDELQFANQVNLLDVKILKFGDLEGLRQQSTAQQELTFDLEQQRDKLRKVREQIIADTELTGKDREKAEDENFKALLDIGEKITESNRREAVIYKQIALQKVTDQDDALKKAKENYKKYLDELKKQLAFEEGLIKLQADQLKAHFKQFSGLFDADIKVRFKVQTDIADERGAAFDNFSKPKKEINDALKKTEEGMTSRNIIYKISIDLQADIKNAEAKAKETVNRLNDSIKSALSDSLSGFAEGLGEALAGGGIEKAFQGFANAISGALQAIGKQLIQIGVKALLAKEALQKLFSNPVLAIAAGAALIAVGAAMKQALGGGLKGFASGGDVVAGVPIRIGERGGEIFVPNTGGKILPHNYVSGGVGGGGNITVQVAGQFILRGNDLIATIANANRSQNRLT